MKIESLIVKISLSNVFNLKFFYVRELHLSCRNLKKEETSLNQVLNGKLDFNTFKFDSDIFMILLDYHLQNKCYKLEDHYFNNFILTLCEITYFMVKDLETCEDRLTLTKDWGEEEIRGGYGKYEYKGVSPEYPANIIHDINSLCFHREEYIVRKIYDYINIYLGKTEFTTDITKEERNRLVEDLHILEILVKDYYYIMDKVDHRGVLCIDRFLDKDIALKNIGIFKNIKQNFKKNFYLGVKVIQPSDFLDIKFWDSKVFLEFPKNIINKKRSWEK